MAAWFFHVFLVRCTEEVESFPFLLRLDQIFLNDLPITLENVKGEFESFGELPSVRETGTESLFQR